MMGISGRFFVDQLMELRNILGFDNNFSILLGNSINVWNLVVLKL